VTSTTFALPAAQASAGARAAFIRRTYGHLAAAVAALVALEALLLRSPIAEPMFRYVAANRYGWLLLLGAFMIAGWLARGLAASGSSAALQYLGLAVYVVAQALFFVPLLYIAVHFSSPQVLTDAAILTGLLFAGLTAVVFTTRRDFSFLRGALVLGGFIALGLIVCAIVFGFHLGLLFSAAMVALAGAAILYDTSNVLHHYPTDRHVGAALELFASLALLFWYVLRIVMRFRE